MKKYFLKQYNKNDLYGKEHSHTEFNSHNSDSNISNLLSSLKIKMFNSFSESKEKNNNKKKYINIFELNSNANIKNSMKNNVLYTPISKKIKNYSNFTSSTSSKSKIETKIINLKKEIGIKSLPASEKKNIDNNIIESFMKNKIYRNKNNCSSLRNCNKTKVNDLRSGLLQNNEHDLKINKNLFEKFKENDNFFCNNNLSKKQIKKKYYQSRNNLKMSIIKNISHYIVKKKKNNKKLIINISLKPKNNIYVNNRNNEIFENININNFIKTRKKKGKIKSISEKLNQLSKDLQSEESIDLENIDNSSIYEKNENNQFDKNNNIKEKFLKERKKISKITFF